METEIPAREMSVPVSPRALVIDDSRTMRAILRNNLRQIGFEVFEAGDGREALERLREIARLRVALVDFHDATTSRNSESPEVVGAARP
jgi:CheY-like chemotaxis protein